MQNERFCETRKRLGLTRAALARALGMSPTTIHAYEKGKHTVPKYVWLAMSALQQKMPLTHEMRVEWIKNVCALMNREPVP